MDEDKGFAVNDRRFSTDETEQEESSSTNEQADAAESAGKQSAARDESRAQALPQVNFPTFVVSLSSSVLVHLGEIEDPASGAKNVNLPVAKQTIDILGMLEEKTKGNLEEDEANLLQNILYDLRMRYVAAAKG